MNKTVKLSLGLLFWTVAHSIGAQPNSYTPTQITEIVTNSLQKDDFGTLDKMGNQFRISKSRSSSGTWNLAIFHSNLRDALYEGRPENSEEQWQRIEGKLSRWVATAPNSPTAPIALAWAQLRHGWFYRGQGSSNTVTSKGWEQFSRYVSMSADTLEKHKRVSSVDPEWYVTMLALAKHRKMKGGEYATLYEEALKAEPLYHSTYITVAEAGLPKWGGSVEQFNAIAADAVRRTNAVEGTAIYARILWAVSDRDRDIWNQMKATGGWAFMKSGFDDMIKQYPDAWNKNAYARFACKAGDVDQFIQQAREFGGKPLADAWPSDYFDRCKAWAVKIRPQSPI